MKTTNEQIEKEMHELCECDEHFWPCASLFFNGDERGTFRSFLNDNRLWNHTPSQVEKMLRSETETLPEVKIDCTPTWESLVLLYAEKATNGNADAQSELLRMARLADSVKPLLAERGELLAALERILYCHEAPSGAACGEAVLCESLADLARAAILKAKEGK